MLSFNDEAKTLVYVLSRKTKHLSMSQ